MHKGFDQHQAAVMAILIPFLKELGSKRDMHTITVDAVLDRDLGIDSLGKVELCQRIEHELQIHFSEQSIASAETVKDLILAIQASHGVEAQSEREFHTPPELAPVDPSDCQSLNEVLLRYAESVPDRAHIHLLDEHDNQQTIRYGQLYQSALAVAGGLQQRGCEPGDTVAIMLPTTEAFFYAFFGILLAGAIPVPIYPPFRADRISEYAMRESTILQNAQVKFLISFREAENLARILRVFVTSLQGVLTVEQLMQSDFTANVINPHTHDPALIQYTSGSTSDPKGVLLSHANLLANIKAYGQGIQVQPSDICVSWLPLYHDMGLIGAWLGSFYYGSPVTLMSPLSFIIRPQSWFWNIHYNAGTVSAAPNFAYELCIKKIKPEDIEGVDLSAWRIALNGAEAVSADTIRRFTEKFSPFGFNPKAMFPAYGLAESSVALCFPALNTLPRIDKIKREPLEQDNIAQPCTDEDASVEFVSCGSALAEHEIRIVDKDYKVLADRHVGQIQFKGPSAMQGYFRNSAATQAIYHDGWWDSGDNAYMADGELFITGRLKDIIIKAGRNLYPEEIEHTAAQVEHVRKGCVCAFSVKDASSGTEKLIIVAEIHKQAKAQKKTIINAIIERVVNVLGLPPDQVVLCDPYSIPKTSSGKLRRSACKQAFLDHTIQKKQSPLWLQISELLSLSVLKKTFSFLYSLYVYVILGLLFIPVSASIFLSSQAGARRGAKFWSRWFFKLIFCPLKQTGQHAFKPNQPCVFIANHASYIDSLILLAVCPSTISFIAKTELQQTPVLKFFMKKLGYIFVDRFDFTQSIQDYQRIHDSLSQTQSIAIFPEGAFSYARGLRPFNLGAFKLAVDTQTPIYPIAIKNSQRFLHHRFMELCPTTLEVKYLDPLTPQKEGFKEANRLKIQAHQQLTNAT